MEVMRKLCVLCSACYAVSMPVEVKFMLLGCNMCLGLTCCLGVTSKGRRRVFSDDEDDVDHEISTSSTDAAGQSRNESQPILPSSFHSKFTKL